jgi:hypothetical protein
MRNFIFLSALFAFVFVYEFDFTYAQTAPAFIPKTVFMPSYVPAPLASTRAPMFNALFPGIEPTQASAVLDGGAAKKFREMCGNPMGAAFCGMSVVAATSSVKNLVASDKAKEGASALQCVGQSCGNGSQQNGVGFYTGSGGTNGGSSAARSGQIPGYMPANVRRNLESSAKEILRDMKGKGYAFDPNTNLVTTPRGSFDAGLLRTADGMKAAGFSDAEVAAAQSGLAEVSSEMAKNLAALDKNVSGAKNIDGGEESSGGGRALYRGKSGSGGDDAMAAYLASLQAANRKPASAPSLQGLSVIVKGEPIGIAGGNIFETINTRYGKLREQGVVGNVSP